MADLTAKASSATSVPGIPVPGNACASKTATSDLSVFEVPNSLRLAAVALHAAGAPATGEALEDPAAAGTQEASAGKFGVGRGEHLHDVGHETSPIAKLTDDRLADSSTGLDMRSEARPALLTLPSEAALMETGQDDRPETPQSIMAIKEPAVYETIIEPTLWERGHFTLEFRRKVVEHALRLPATARMLPTCRAYAASGIHTATLREWLRKEGVPPPPKYTHSCKQCPLAGPCKKGAGCTRRDQCEHMHQRHACRRGLCPARQLNAKAGYGYYADDEIVAVLRRAPPPRFCIKALPLGSRRVSWPMGMPTSGEALRHAMKPAAGKGRRVHAPSSLGL
jgi:hypothetical protein